MSENMKAFLDAVSKNEELKKKFAELSDKEQEELKGHIAEYSALAKEPGITLTEEDFRQDNSTEMSDEELKAVAGGSTMLCPIAGAGPACFCFLYGASSGSECIGYGDYGLDF